MIVPALRAAGLSTDLRTYDLRHAHASILFDLGHNPLSVGARMGHTDPSVTLNVYGHTYNGAQAKLTVDLDGARIAAQTRLDEAADEVIELDTRRESRDVG